VHLAEESVKLTRERFESGLALAAQLIDAETALTAARVRRAEAETDRRVAVAALRRALGMNMIPTSSK
jgi:outer membrane protein TolC